VILIGVGNGWRGDDGAGLAVARRVRELAPTGVEVREVEGDATALVEAWAGAEHVVLVDAAQSGAAAGTVQRFDARTQPLPVRSLRSSTHAFGVSDAVELSRSLGRRTGTAAFAARCESTSSKSGMGSPMRSCTQPSGQSPPLAATSIPSLVNATIAARSSGPRRPVTAQDHT
jgi:hydrogenase maturation protease